MVVSVSCILHCDDDVVQAAKVRPNRCDLHPAQTGDRTVLSVLKIVPLKPKERIAA